MNVAHAAEREREMMRPGPHVSLGGYFVKDADRISRIAPAAWDCTPTAAEQGAFDPGGTASMPPTGAGVTRRWLCCTAPVFPAFLAAQTGRCPACGGKCMQLCLDN